MADLKVELLVLLGIKRELAVQIASRLETVVQTIVDPAQRATEVAVAIAELKDGNFPSILNFSEENAQ